MAPSCGQTYTSENITFPQLRLRAVKIDCEICLGPPFTDSQIFSLHIRSMWETTVMHKQVSGRTVNFGPNFPDQSLLRNTPPPPISENFRFGITKVYSGIPPPPFWKTSDLGSLKLLRNTPPLENFRFGITKVYSGIPPPFGKLQIWDHQSLLRNTPPPPHFGKLQIWDHQSLLRNTPPFWKTSDLGWPKFTPESPPPPVRESKSEIFRIPRVATCGDFIQPG